MPYEVREYDKNGNMIGDFRDIYLIARMPYASTSKEAHVTPATGEVQYVYKDDGELVDGGKHYLIKDSVNGYGLRVVGGGLMDGPEWIISLTLEDPIPKISKSAAGATALSFNTIPSNLEGTKITGDNVMDVQAATTVTNFTTELLHFDPPALRGTDPETGEFKYHTSMLKYNVLCEPGKTPVPGSTGKFTIKQFDRTFV